MNINNWIYSPNVGKGSKSMETNQNMNAMNSMNNINNINNLNNIPLNLIPGSINLLYSTNQINGIQSNNSQNDY
jgi:hypothetical protein